MDYKYLKYKHKYLQLRKGGGGVSVGGAVSDALNKLEPIQKKFNEDLIKQGGKPLSKLSVAEARKLLDDLQAGSVIDAPTTKTEVKIPNGANDFSIFIVRPKAATEKLPAIIFVHGAGWILGNFGTHERMVREISYGANVAVVF
ncbi:MAG: alpha/beta hydrolase, partial [Harvfovirus sp.]